MGAFGDHASDDSTKLRAPKELIPLLKAAAKLTDRSITQFAVAALTQAAEQTTRKGAPTPLPVVVESRRAAGKAEVDALENSAASAERLDAMERRLDLLTPIVQRFYAEPTARVAEDGKTDDGKSAAHDAPAVRYPAKARGKGNDFGVDYRRGRHSHLVTLMKLALLLVSFFALAACEDASKTAKEKAVREGRVTLAMTSDEVRRSRGNPIIREVQPDGREVWGFGDGTLVTLSKGRVIGAEKHELPPPASAKAPQKKLTYVPGLGRYVEHDAYVSPMRSIGGGGGGAGAPRPPTPHPATPRLKGTALDQPARR